MNQDKQYQSILNEYKTKAQYVTHFSGLVKQVLESPYSNSWAILDYLLVTAQSKDKRHFLQLCSFIERNIQNIRSFTTFMYVYSIKVTRKDVSMYTRIWRQKFQSISRDKGQLKIIAYVDNGKKSKIVQDTLQLTIKIFPSLIKNQHIQLSQAELGIIMEWVASYDTPDPDKFNDVGQLIKTIKQSRYIMLQANAKKQHLLLKKLIEVACQFKNASSNIFLFIYPMLISQKQIAYFCQIYSQFISDIGEEGLSNLFNSLTKGAITKQSLIIIDRISNILVNQQQFYKLRVLYQNYILPCLVERAKACKKVQQAVLHTSSLYILGFLKHCDIGVQGIRCVIKNIGKIKSQSIQQRWVQICFIIKSRYPELGSEIIQGLKRQLNGKVQFNSSQIYETIQDPNTVWDITLRSGRKHKKYIHVPSRMRGIVNEGNECYIISVVHGLQKNELLQKLLDQNSRAISKKYKLLDQLKMLFAQISGRKPCQKIIVRYLKKVSPQKYAISRHQEDANQYLIQLIPLMENEMKNVPGMLEQFKSIFQIQVKNIINCKKCKNLKQLPNDNYYVHTIPYTAILQESTQQPLEYKCEKCGDTNNSAITRKMVPQCKVLIVHINRFSVANGQTKKQLSNQRILRKFLNYELVGMICHRGKKMERGHYIYYHRLSLKRWALFNDLCVDEFELDVPQEQFEREWNSETTPYILFYQTFKQ